MNKQLLNRREFNGLCVALGSSLCLVGPMKWSQRFRATGSAAAYWMGGHRPRVLAGERDWLLARLAEKPDLTLRAMVAELVQRGVPARYGAVWRLLKAEGITVKKKPVRRRAGSPRRDPPAAAVEEASEPA